MRRKGRKQLVLSPIERFHTLVQAGYSVQTIGTRIVEVVERDKAIIKRLYQHPNKERQHFWLLHGAKYNDKEAVDMLFNFSS